MKKMLLFTLAMSLMLAAGTAFAAAKKQARAADDAPELKTGMEGKIGIGFDSIPGADATGGASVAGLSTPNALDVRYWSSDIMCLDGMLAFTSGSQPGGTDSSGKSVNNSTSAFGLGAGVNYTWKKPVEDLLVQFIGKVSFASAGNTQVNAGTSYTTTTTTFALFAGTGFEAFIPAWRALSVEGNVGLGLSSASSSVNVAGATSTSTSSFGISGNGFTPINVAVHYYFN